MEMGNILSADVLDIIFDQRNKEYGAYDLRKNYQRRLTKAILVTLLVVVLMCLTYILLGAIKPPKKELQVEGTITIEKIPDEKPIEKVPPPLVKQTPPPEIKMLKSTPPIIVKEDVPDDEKPPLNDDLETAKIGTVNTKGIDDDGAITPPVKASTGVVDAPKKIDDDGAIIDKVEIESEYPGGLKAWALFLTRKLVYPQEAVDNGTQGTVQVRFIVDREGNVSDVTAISGPEDLRAAAVAVVKKSGQWTAAIQNGNKVKSYKTQPITFQLANDQ